VSAFTDRMELGFFPLQDHAAAQDGVPVSVRHSLGAGRITRFTDPTRASSAEESMIEYGREYGMGTLGDVHPWFFWQTRERSVRGMGAWSQVFGTFVTDVDARYGNYEVAPVRDDFFHSDTRFRPKSLTWPVGFNQLARGTMLLALPGTEEAEQHELAFWADPRLVAPNVSGSGACGTLVVDLQPADTLCMGNSDTPGIGGRHARLQTLTRVIAVRPNQSLGALGAPGNVLALNYSRTGSDGIPGFGAIFGPVIGGGGPTRPGGTGGGPITGGGGQQSRLLPNGDPEAGYGVFGNRSARGETNIGSGAFGAGVAEDSGAGSEELTPKGFGEFVPSRTASHGVGLMAATVTYGPIHCGAENDKHQHGRDADGHPINSAHVSTGAYFFRNADQDGPLLFEGQYPYPPSYPLTAKTHLTWDPAVVHPFTNGFRAGVWRWWTEVPFYSPTQDPGGPGRPGGGRGPTRPGGPGPGGPTTPGPGGPSTPGPGKPRGGRGPTTGGRGPTTGGPRRGGRGTRGPTTGGKGPGGRGGRDGSAPPPIPVTLFFDPASKREPKQPPTANPNDPPNPGTGSTRPGSQPPSTQGICSDPANYGDPNNPTSAQNTTAVPTHQATFGASEVVPAGVGLFVGGPAGGGTQVTDPRIPMGRISGRDPWSWEEVQIPGVVERVGTGDRDAVGLYAIHHPFHESYAAISFRPQLWVNGYPNFEHNPQVPQALIQRDERARPQVLTMRAWGAQSAASGDWDYVESPAESRARGGTGDGGVLFCPPRFEMEDYFGINSGANVSDVTSAQATRGYVLAAPGVSFALGKPAATGALQPNAAVIAQDMTSAATPLRVTHDDAEVLRAYKSGTEVLVELGRGGTTGITIPSGTTAQRPAAPVSGSVRINTDTSTTPRASIEYYDAANAEWVGVSNEASQVYKACKNTTASSIAKGTPVYITGRTGDRINIAPADAANAATMPAAGITDRTLAAGNEGFVIIAGLAKFIDVGAATVGQTLYVNGSGSFTTTRPTFPDLVQNIGKVVKEGSNGSILVFGPGRTNDVPNLDTKHVFIGKSDGTVEQRQLTSSDIAGGGTGGAVGFESVTVTSGNFASDLDACSRRFVLRNTSSTNSFVELFRDGSSTRANIPDMTSWTFTAHFVGQESGGTDRASFIRRGCIYNKGGATSLEGAIQTIGTDIASNVNWEVKVTADNTNDSLKLEAHGDSGQDVAWVVMLDLIQVTYP